MDYHRRRNRCVLACAARRNRSGLAKSTADARVSTIAYPRYRRFPLTTIDRLFRNARLADGRTADIAVKDGSIVAIASTPKTYGSVGETIDLGRRLLLPGL